MVTTYIVVFLDVIKAFDGSYYGKVFNILIDKKVPFCIIRLLLDCYMRHEERVVWNECESSYFFIFKWGKTAVLITNIILFIYDRFLCILYTN